MRIGVISDTHISDAACTLPEKVCACFKSCDLIVHAGDHISMAVIEELTALAEVRAVCGNMDDLEIQQKLPEKIVFEAAGKTIGVTHGRGPAFKLIQRIDAVFKKKPDIIIFGHSHEPFNEQRGNTLYFNPGSATDTVFAKYRSFGVIEIDGDDIRAEIIKCDD